MVLGANIGMRALWLEAIGILIMLLVIWFAMKMLNRFMHWQELKEHISKKEGNK